MTENKKLQDDTLKQVNGGYINHDMASKDCDVEIKCTHCGESREEYITANDVDDMMDPGTYHCKSCGRNFYPQR